MKKALPGAGERVLLRALQSDSGRSIRELAKEAGLPLSTAHEKIKRLRREGFITKFCAHLDAKKLGFPATGFVYVSFSTSPGKGSASRMLAGEIAALPGVQEAYLLSGDWDMLLKVRAESVDSLGRLVSEKLRAIPGVGKAKVEVAFESVKEGTELPL